MDASDVFDFDGLDLFKPMARPKELIKLRPYQIEAVEAAFRSWNAGYKAPLLVKPTGSGKTITFAEIARRILPERTVVLAHREELIRQAQDKIERVTGVRAGIEMAGERAKATDQIVIATVQTLARGRKIAGPDPKLVIIDESHHVASESYLNVIKALGAPLLLGVTATPYRGDKKALSNVFDDNPFSMSMLDMIELGRASGGKEGLCDIQVKTLPVKIDMSAVHVQSGDFVAGEVGAALEPILDELAGIVARDYADRKLLAFCPLRATSRLWTEALIARGLPAAHVQGDSPDRAEILKAFARDDIRFLSNSAVLIEGYDEPSIDTVLMLRPTKSRGLLAQAIGRGTRLFPGKSHMLVLDPMFVCERHNIMRASSLVAEDDKQAQRIAELMDTGRTLTEASQDATEERKRALAEQITASGKRSGYEKKLADLALALDDAGLADWEPTMGWHSEAPTAKQLAALENMGVDIAIISSKGQACYVMDRLMKRRNDDLATLKQIRYARRLGHPEPEKLTFAEMSAWLNENAKPFPRRAAA
jgi:superfamily II DNA or RNA helicase